MDFKFNLIGPEIRLVVDTDEGVQHIEASTDQLIGELTPQQQADFVEEAARAYCSQQGQGSLQDRIMEIVDDNMTETGARALINKLIGKYHL